MKSVRHKILILVLSIVVLVSFRYAPISASPGGRTIIVGDSRTVLMSKWVEDSNCIFIAKNSIGYEWLVGTAVDRVNKVKQPGDNIIVWLGVNDYNSEDVGKYPYEKYAAAISSFTQNEWSDCSVYVASAGYVDRTRIVRYYNKDNRSNRSQIMGKSVVGGLKEFNDQLKHRLSSKITWIDLEEVIGIEPYDVNTESDIWLTRDNGKKDGLHYGEDKTLEIYEYLMQELS